MEKKLLALLLIAVLVMSFALSGCGKTEEAPAEEPQEEEQQEETEDEAEFPGAEYGYAGDDPTELAAYKYMVEEVGKNYDKADVSIPVVNIFHADYTNEDEVIIFGDFELYNYNIEGDTLKTVSGGDYPGVMHLAPEGDGYKVTAMEVTEDGAGFEESAKKLFGDDYEDFAKIHSDDEAREELRRVTVSDYVNMNGLDITKYQDEGWDPVELYK